MKKSPLRTDGLPYVLVVKRSLFGRLFFCLMCLLGSSRIAFGWIDNGGTVPIDVLDDVSGGHPGTVVITWSGDGGNGSVTQQNYDPGARSAGTQYNATNFAYVSCETVYSCPPGGRLTVNGTVSGGATDGTWQISGTFYAQGLSCEDNGNLENAFFTWSVTLSASGMHSKPNDLKTCSADGVGMAHASAHLALASLNIEDTPLRYQPGRGPALDFTVTYNERGIQQLPNVANIGASWTFNWLSYATDNPSDATANVCVFVPRGGEERYAGFDQGSVSSPDPQSHALLVRTSTFPIRYEKQLPDGSKQVFDVGDGSSSYPRRVFMTQLIDPAGNMVTIGYDGLFRITTLTDALGGVTTLAYEDLSHPLRITKVTDPFGRFASLQYTNGLLATITDEIGIQSVFNYVSGTGSLETMATPYGTTLFSRGQVGNNRWLEITDPLGGKERIEYRDYAPGIPSSDPAAPNAPGISNSGLDVANTFYWDKKAMEVAPGDYTKAKITHWLYNADGTISGIPSSEKMPLENRVWYTYAGQPDANHAASSANPSQIARVMANGSTQLSQFEYNSIGNTTKAVDPLGRVTSYTYDTNSIDLLTIYQRNPAGVSTDPEGLAADKVASYTYNSLHEARTETDAAGQSTLNDYNSFGQISARTNARNEQTIFGYGDGTPGKPIGHLTSITSPQFNGLSAVTNLTYDGLNRVRTVTDSDAYTVTTDYDNLDRKTKVTYPDGTYQQFQYTDNVTGAMTLDLTGSRDRRGLWTYHHYNANRQMDSITDPENRTTHYGWCNCGALESITDPKTQITTFHRDLQGRVYQKAFNDGTAINYLYEGQSAPDTPGATSRVQSSTDPKNQRTNYTYFADDNLAQITYTDTNGQSLNPPTPSVTYSYAPSYNRVATMVDGSGTTVYVYNAVTVPPGLGANRLASIDGPISNDTITFSYDELGRVSNRQINGSANSETWSYDSLGRLNSDANKVGTFNYNYVGVTNRLQTLTYPNGATANYSYFPNLQDKRLQQIKNQTSTSALLSQFDYTYDAEGQIQTWTKNYPGLPTAQRYDLDYDNADQLTNAPLKKTTNNALIRQYVYGYDFAANRTSEQVGNNTTISTPNNVNEITSQSGATNRILSYDANGSLTSDGGTRTFEWDAANRLVAINYSGTNLRSEFSYDALSRCVKIVEKTGTTVNSTRKFVWCGMEKCEYRNANGAVQLQFFSQAQYQGGSNGYYYTRDHLGSIREMTNASGTVVARYDYDPWGRSTTVIGTNKPDFNFTGLYQHAKSGLDMAVYRFYDSELGRWLNRDPIGEKGGSNLYSYVDNHPLNLSDILGLKAHILVYRTSPTSPASVLVYQDGQYIGSTFANTNGFFPNSHPPLDGTYSLLPRDDYKTGDKFADGTPRVVDLDFVHPNSKSKGCLTVDLDWADRIWDIMEANMNSGGTTITYLTVPYPKAIPVEGPLPAPNQHSWPVFNLVPPY